MEIAPNVYWFDGRSSNLFLCVDEDGLTLVDTGMPRKQNLVFDAIRQIGYQPSDLARILITHADIDHAGSAAIIQKQTGAIVYTGRETAELMYAGKSPKHMPWYVQILLDRVFTYPPIPRPCTKIFQDGDILPILNGLKVLATPGHTNDHHSFYSPTTGVLFAGDALNTRKDRLQCTPSRITANDDAARRSAIRLLELAPAVIACGHGAPMSHHSSDQLMELFNELRSI